MRVIDAFVEHLDIKKLGVKTAAIEGRPSYDPKVFTNSIFMEAEKESVPHGNWQRVAK